MYICVCGFTTLLIHNLFKISQKNAELCRSTLRLTLSSAQSKARAPRHTLDLMLEGKWTMTNPIPIPCEIARIRDTKTVIQWDFIGKSWEYHGLVLMNCRAFTQCHKPITWGW